ncbi:iron ABC transporter ATP-binding protein [Advenella kashmirensis W13003]|uniref:Iron ABC transporter ATP-binding protein n=1 Tax=Advenella kashmirensis W13003 TaxID=1424334 RepID=V8QRT1_9BURK|nr:ATP-binding cassette domain-containing protein [Advenella kashmirensis]ETF02686.1 iron ABC transporter ATP-binding protein [Advenella kashmirensis W13003]
MIKVNGVSKDYANQRVVDDVSIEIAPGGVTSIVGPNGAGKSTLLGMISRLLPMSAGTVQVGGLDVTRADTAELARHLSILRQDNHLPLRLTVQDVVAFGRYPHTQGRLTVQDKGHIEKAIAYLNLQGLEGRFLDELSGGQRQRAFIAMVLCQDTEYVLLDEPLNSLDMKNAVDIMKVVRRAADELHKTVVLVLHDINFASCYSDMIIGMRNGRVLHQGPPQTFIQPSIIKALYGLDVAVHEWQNNRICVHYT